MQILVMGKPLEYKGTRRWLVKHWFDKLPVNKHMHVLLTRSFTTGGWLLAGGCSLEIEMNLTAWITFIIYFENTQAKHDMFVIHSHMV